MKAGQRSLSAFMMPFSMLTIAVGFVTSSEKLFGRNKRLAAPLRPPWKPHPHYLSLGFRRHSKELRRKCRGEFIR